MLPFHVTTYLPRIQSIQKHAHKMPLPAAIRNSTRLSQTQHANSSAIQLGNLPDNDGLAMHHVGASTVYSFFNVAESMK